MLTMRLLHSVSHRAEIRTASNHLPPKTLESQCLFRWPWRFRCRPSWRRWLPTDCHEPVSWFLPVVWPHRRFGPGPRSASPDMPKSNDQSRKPAHTIHVDSAAYHESCAPLSCRVYCECIGFPRGIRLAGPGSILRQVLCLNTSNCIFRYLFWNDKPIVRGREKGRFSLICGRLKRMVRCDPCWSTWNTCLLTFNLRGAFNETTATNELLNSRSTILISSLLFE